MRNKRDKENNNELFIKDENITFGYFNVLPQPQELQEVFPLEITQDINPVPSSLSTLFDGKFHGCDREAC